MSFSFSHSKKEKIVAILDIGSSSVGGALVSLKNDSIPEILYSVREDMVLQDNLNLARFTSSMLSTLDRVLADLGKKAQEPPRDFICTLSSSWHISTTKTIKVSKELPFTVTRKMLDGLVNKEAREFISKTEEGKQKERGTLEAIDIKNIHVKLNGYETNNPYEKRVNNIEITLFISTSEEKTTNLIREKIYRTFHTKDVLFSAFSLAAFTTIRDIFSDKKDFLFLDITGEVTDVSIIRNNTLLEVSSFPMGKNFVMRKIASGLNTSLEEAGSLFNLLNMNKIDDVALAVITPILSDARKEWLSSFTNTIIGFSKNFSIPAAVFFTADPDIAKWFTESIEKEEFGQIILASDSFDALFLDQKILGKFCSFGKGVVQDPFIILASIFAARNKEAV